MFYNDEFDRFFKSMFRSVNLDDLFEDVRSTSCVSGPFYYGYTMTVGPDGRPVVKQYGNAKPELSPTSDAREPLVDTLVDNKEKLVRLIAEMPGVEKKDVKIVVDGKIVNIDAERGDKKYHVKVPLTHKVDENSVKASYKNGILEIIFKQLAEEKPKGKTVEVE